MSVSAVCGSKRIERKSTQKRKRERRTEKEKRKEKESAV